MYYVIINDLIWDDRAEMRIRVKTYNRQGELLETNETTLTRAEVMQREKVLFIRQVNCLGIPASTPQRFMLTW